MGLTASPNHSARKSFASRGKATLHRKTPWPKKQHRNGCWYWMRTKPFRRHYVRRFNICLPNLKSSKALPHSVFPVAHSIAAAGSVTAIGIPTGKPGYGFGVGPNGVG